MIRMEVALILILCLVAILYFSTFRQKNTLHNIFSVLLVVVLINLIFDAITIYTVNHLDTIPALINEILHRIFISSMIVAVYLFYKYISVLTQPDKKRNRIPVFILILCIFSALVLPIHYVETSQGNYSYGPYVFVVYICVFLYLCLCIFCLLKNYEQLTKKERAVIGFALMVEFIVCVIQVIQPITLISGMGLTLMTLSFYLTLENPAYLQGQLVEQKMSMLYLKSQVNPHFLYNTLDTIRIQAQLNGDKEVSNLLMRLVDFFRLSVKVDRQMVALDDEMDLLEAYIELMCYRYPQIECEYEVGPELGDKLVPNFICQPLVENSFLHGLKNKGYKGKIKIKAFLVDSNFMEIQIQDSGNGFSIEKKEQVDFMLKNYAKQEFRLDGNSIGLLNVQKRIKLLCGEESGLSYTQDENGTVAHIRLSIEQEKI